MTTFNEILGTTAKDLQATVKQRYKLLCNRVHPDKGGSKALMQLVCHAYENISKGKGECALTLAPAMPDKEKERLNKELTAAQKERDALFGLNKQLSAQLAKKTPPSPNLNADYGRKIALLEGEILLLKEDRHRINGQKDAAMAEQYKLATELRKALTENEIVETDSNHKLSANFFNTRLRNYAPLYSVLGLFLLSGIVFFTATAIDWDDVSAMFKAKQVEKPPKVRVVHAPQREQKAEKVVTEVKNDEQDQDNRHLQPFLQLSNDSGIWSLAAYQGTAKPYIAIRSDNGSYVVNDCSGSFTFYLNQSYKPLRVAANLIYSHQNQQFHVYKIPYGQGSSPHSWLQSRKLQINDDYFTSEKFGVSRAALAEHCLASTS